MSAHLVPIAFLVFVTVCAVAGIVTDYKKRKAALEPLRAAIERGQQLDPALVDRLMAPEKSSGLAPISLMVGGIIACAAGIGVVILSIFIAQVEAAALYPVMGAGIVAVCVGTGLILASRAVEQYRLRHAGGPNGR
ncbi:MAG TPA: hypothetical protein VKT54_00390 [Steroidobacteraceae bacterium]|nr:hypothetical protein [Steroidobacteraceae bacterium]